MALSDKIKLESYNSLVRVYEGRLNETDKQLLSLINDFAADDDIALHLQGVTITDYLIDQIKEAKSEQYDDISEVSNLIYGLVLNRMETHSQSNRNRHRNQGRFDQSGLHLRSARDQLQDHDMTLLMPNSTGNISVMAVLNRYDPSSALAIQDVLASELFNENIQHIIIPVGPGHWRGVYLTKPTEDEVFYELELFDPYGPSGASAIKDYTLKLLEQCGLNKELIRIKYSGPKHPQGDAYSCGDFTCAHSHKKMQELGAPTGSYNQNLITTLDNLGNKDDVLRMATRDEIQRKLEGPRVIHPPIDPRVSSGVTIKNPEQTESPVLPISTNSSDALITPVTQGTSAVTQADTPANSSVLPVVDQEKNTDVIKASINDGQPPLEINKDHVRVTSDSDDKITQTTNLSSGARIGIEAGSIAGSTGIGALIGGLIGFFVLPVVGALVGSLVGAGIGVLLSSAAVGLGRLFWSADKIIPQEPSLKSEGTETSASKSNTRSYSIKDHSKQDHAQDQEPMFSPPLFRTASPQISGEQDATVEIRPEGPK
ncbi:DUF456 domain-containing protein [Legionella bononiensis]|uniref:DUF456 domain-containing protein n=1 Tax=Legionella bononiensis TaxID=2793102 RepID=A0ABS1WG57_9GAMM|nr:DUF456 domain-containing protein [Legionella bononiensis]MBL7481788.1 DUF456 domain-containing protein [Legionella bononiensis]MBL7528337.1 DUF456 domain-containing protein [Legionella bononiensis]MBL7564300.1 DUF456 domain-containing protein [Legionella bononiensis]